MNKLVSARIIDFKFDDSNFTLETDKGSFHSKIKKGCIDCEILSNEKKILPLSYLEKNDLVQLKVDNNKILKIYINLKYEFYSDSSEDEDYF